MPYPSKAGPALPDAVERIMPNSGQKNAKKKAK
jgi:hypothetical protein